MDRDSDPILHVDARWIGLRVMLPFAFDRPTSHAGLHEAGVPESLLQSLAALTFRDAAVWRPETPPQLYLDEALDSVERAVFPREARHYWRVESVTRDRIFKNAFVNLGDHGTVRLEPCAPFGIELFLSDFGFGMLSLAIAAELPQGNGAAVAAELVYRLSQVRDAKRTPLQWPHPFDDPEKKSRIIGQGAHGAIAPPPSPDAPASVRLGAPGGSVALPELARFLLPFEVAPFQVGLAASIAGDFPAFSSGQFNAYSVVCIDNPADHTLSSHPARKSIGCFLAGLAQIHEPQHAGNEPEDGHVVMQLLNRRHSAAVTSLAAAHVVLDQPQHEPWNIQAPQHYLGKYFIPALLAHHQRRQAGLVVEASRAAAERLLAADDDAVLAVNAITYEMLQFELSAAFPTVSHRHVLSVWYEQCLEGEQAALALTRAREAIARLDVALARVRQEKLARLTARLASTNADLAAASKKNLDVVAHVQKNVEWIEIFIVGVYMVEVAHKVLEAFHVRDRAAHVIGVIGLPMLAALVAFRVLRPDQTDDAAAHGSAPRFWRSQLFLLLALGGLIVAWAAVCWSISGQH